MTRQQDHERAHDLALKADGEKLEKRRKAEEEAMHKVNFRNNLIWIVFMI